MKQSCLVTVKIYLNPLIEEKNNTEKNIQLYHTFVSVCISIRNRLRNYEEGLP